MKTGTSALQYEGVANRHDVECALARLHNNLINNLTSQSDVPILMTIYDGDGSAEEEEVFAGGGGGDADRVYGTGFIHEGDVTDGSRCLYHYTERGVTGNVGG